MGLSRIKGNALCVRVFTKDSGRVPFFEYGTWEAGSDILIDYAKLDRGLLSITTYTEDVRKMVESDSVPFVRTTVTLDPKGKYSHRTELLMLGEDGTDSEIKRLAGEIRRAVANQATPDTEPDRHAYTMLVAFARLRGIGIAEPTKVLPVFQKLQQALGDDGGVTGLIDDYRGDVLMARDVRAGNRAGTDCQGPL